MNPKIAYAIAATLGGAPFSVTPAWSASGGSDADAGALEEIIVTAQHRSQGIQDVPISMQAFTEARLPPPVKL